MSAHLITSHTRLVNDVNQIRDVITCLPQTQPWMDERLTTLKQNCKDNRMEHNHHEEGPNHHYNRDPQNVNRDLGIKVAIPEFDGKMH